MLSFLYENLKKGIKKVTKNPQLIYTIVVAALIVSAFVFVSERFIGIANDAGERLINVRIGSLQDAFVSFAKDKMNDGAYLNQKIAEVVAPNETIKDFRVVSKRTDVDPLTGVALNTFQVIASNHKEEIGTQDDQAQFLFSLASSDPNHSLTIALADDHERLFKTIRVILDPSGNPSGAVISVQTLSMADMVIKDNIKNSRILLFGILILVIFLFLRHSRIIDYVDLYKRLKEIDQMKDNFIAMASHELKTPLLIIRGYADFISKAPEISVETKDYVSKIDVGVKELNSLISEILDVSRIEQGRMSFNLEKVNPVLILDEIVSSFIMQAKEKNLSLSFDKSKVEGELFVNIDSGRFKQAMVNLIGNAIKYTPKGEVAVRIYKEHENLLIRVSDSGVGMSEEERAKLFEKFYRIRNTETQEIRGTGLGLWITKGIILQMGGKISVESIKGVGSHFIVSFPMVS